MKKKNTREIVSELLDDVFNDVSDDLGPVSNFDVGNLYGMDPDIPKTLKAIDDQLQSFQNNQDLLSELDIKLLTEIKNNLKELSTNTKSLSNKDMWKKIQQDIELPIENAIRRHDTISLGAKIFLNKLCKILGLKEWFISTDDEQKLIDQFKKMKSELPETEKVSYFSKWPNKS